MLARSVMSLIAVVALSATQARADHCRDVGAVACDLQSQVGAAAREIYFHFREAPQFAPTYLVSLELYRHAEQLHALADAGASDAQLCRALECMQPLHSRLDAQIERWEAIATPVDGAIAWRHAHPPLAGGYVSQFHAERLCDQLSQVKAMMERIDAILHPGTAAVPDLPQPPGTFNGLPAPPVDSPRAVPGRIFVPPQPVPVQPMPDPRQYQGPQFNGPELPLQSHRGFTIRKKGVAFSVVIR